VPTTSATTAIVQNDFRLASVLATGQKFAVPGSYFPTRDIAINAIPYVADFSPIRAYSRYSFEIFLRTNPGNTTPDTIESVRILAPLMPPDIVLNLPMNDVGPSIGLVTFGAPAIPANSAFAVNWTNNLQAAPVGTASLYAEEFNSAQPANATLFFSIRTAVPGAYAVKAVPSSQLVTVPAVDSDPNCTSGRVAAFDGATGVYREVTVSSLQSHSRVYSSMGWNR
jgi:hypothetical protein